MQPMLVILPACHSAIPADSSRCGLQIIVPKTYHEFTTRRVLTAEWIEGEKLSQSTADDVGDLVGVGVIAYLKCAPISITSR